MEWISATWQFSYGRRQQYGDCAMDRHRRGIPAGDLHAMPHIRTAVTAVCLTLALGLTGCNAPATGKPVDVLVSGKRFGAPPLSCKLFVDPSSVTLYATPQAAWLALEQRYVYELSSWSIDDEYGQQISGGIDTWLYPAEVQRLIDDHTTTHKLDCQAGAAWLTSALRRQGLNAWLCVGVVSMPSGSYGHAWTEVYTPDVTTLYETTTGDILPERPTYYHLAWRTTESECVISDSVSAAMALHSLPVDRVGELALLNKGMSIH